MHKIITILDPALYDNVGNNSPNLGDLIISESVNNEIRKIFPEYEIHRISSHIPLNRASLSIIKESEFTFFGGTNMLCSAIHRYNQWKYSSLFYDYYFPKIKNIILLGVGWWQYQNAPSFFSRHFYNSVLAKSFKLSVRDGYTKKMLGDCGIYNTINTSCPTVWNLAYSELKIDFTYHSDCLFMLTDYNRDIKNDSALIELIIQNTRGMIYFFPQGIRDIQYLNSLDIFKKNKNKITVLGYDLRNLYDLISNNTSIIYIGTRLHGGIKCIQQNIPSLIITIDNRAKEIGNEINIPICDRSNLNLVNKWMQGNHSFGELKIPVNAITEWKNQFTRV